MSLVLNAVTILLVLAGAFFFLAGTVGLLRFPDALTRLHALTKADSLGLGLIVLGLLPQVASLADGLKLLLVFALAAFGGATASQIVARFTRTTAAPAQGLGEPEGGGDGAPARMTGGPTP